MAEPKNIVVEFHWTMAHFLLETVREQLGEQHPLLGKLIFACDQHEASKKKEVSISFSNDEAGREELRRFRFVVGILASSFTHLEGKLLSL